jgi:hypothetical protein
LFRRTPRSRGTSAGPQDSHSRCGIAFISPAPFRHGLIESCEDSLHLGVRRRKYQARTGLRRPRDNLRLYHPRSWSIRDPPRRQKGSGQWRGRCPTQRNAAGKNGLAQVTGLRHHPLLRGVLGRRGSDAHISRNCRKCQPKISSCKRRVAQRQKLTEASRHLAAERRPLALHHFSFARVRSSLCSIQPSTFS